MRGTTLKRALTNAFALVFVAVGLPAFLGLGLLSASVVTPLASLSIFLVSDLAADSFSGPLAGMDRSRLLLRFGASVMRGWISGIVILMAALAAMNAMFWTGELQLPSTKILIDAGVFSFAACVLVAGIALTIARKSASARSAKLVLKVILVTATLCVIYGCHKAEDERLWFPTTERITRLTWVASAFLLANGAALVAFAANGLPTRRPEKHNSAD
jgi:hypothetical protein